jgi:DNA repair protein RadC
MRNENRHEAKSKREEGSTMTAEKLFCKRNSPEKPRTIKIKQIKAVFETFTIKEEVDQHLNPFTRYTSPEQVFNTFNFLRQETKEYFFAIHLDGKNRICCIDEVSVGSLNQSIVHPREVFKTALLSSAAALILLHNHPTGDPTPSREDHEITRRIKEAGDVLGVRLLDHIIIGDGFLSFASEGLL